MDQEEPTELTQATPQSSTRALIPPQQQVTTPSATTTAVLPSQRQFILDLLKGFSFSDLIEYSTSSKLTESLPHYRG